MRMPEAVVGWLNGRLVEAGREVTVRAIDLDQEGTFQVMLQVVRHRIRVDAVVSGRLEGEGPTLVVRDLDVRAAPEAHMVGRLVARVLHWFRRWIRDAARAKVGPLGVDLR